MDLNERLHVASTLGYMFISAQEDFIISASLVGVADYLVIIIFAILVGVADHFVIS